MSMQDIVAHKSPPVVSVIIPFHNREKMLNELLRSIPDIPEVEVIAVDDHSTDDVKIEVNFEHADFTRLCAQSNQRYAGAARNQGMAASRGEYLFFADSDDLIESNAFRTRVRDILGRVDVDIFYTQFHAFDNDTGTPGTRHLNMLWALSRARETGNRDYLFRLHVPWAKFIRRDFVEKNELTFSETDVSNDVLFNFRMCSASGRFEILDDVVYLVREGNGSLTTVRSREGVLTRFRIQEEYNQGLISLRKRQFRSPGYTYIRQMWDIDKIEAIRMFAHCIRHASPVLSPLASLRFWISRKIWARRRNSALQL